jgi:hypothetical protein
MRPSRIRLARSERARRTEPARGTGHSQMLIEPTLGGATSIETLISRNQTGLDVACLSALRVPPDTVSVG